MTRIVQCRKYKTGLEGLAKAPFPGPKGQDIFDNISAKAWQEWQEHQTRLINEKHLNMMDMTARKYIQEQMEKFLSGDDYDKIEGYMPAEDNK